MTVPGGTEENPAGVCRCVTVLILFLSRWSQTSYDLLWSRGFIHGGSARLLKGHAHAERASILIQNTLSTTSLQALLKMLLKCT